MACWVLPPSRAAGAGWVLVGPGVGQVELDRARWLRAETSEACPNQEGFTTAHELLLVVAGESGGQQWTRNRCG